MKRRRMKVVTQWDVTVLLGVGEIKWISVQINNAESCLTCVVSVTDHDPVVYEEEEEEEGV